MPKLNATPKPVLLPSFVPASSLWEGEKPIYPSEQSALWAIRQMRRALAEAGAIALLRGRTMINLERFTQVAESDAIDKARKKYCTN